MTIEFPDIIVPTCKSAEAVAPLMSDMQGFSLGCRTMATCRPLSAAANRNIGLDWARSSIIIMLDDDICGFGSCPEWWKKMIQPLIDDKTIVVVSARLLNPDQGFGPMMFAGNRDTPLTDVPRVPTACIAFRNDGTRLDDGTLMDSLNQEGFIGSGFEDDDFCARLAEKYPKGRFVINNDVRLIHFNEMKNQANEYWRHNKSYFDRQWNNLGTERKRKTAPPEVDQFWNITKILHFVWIGPEMPDWIKANIAEFERLNPEYQTMVHGEESLDKQFKVLYDRITDPAYGLSMKSDLIRLSVLIKFGGWYWDCDFWPLVSIADICKAVPGMRRRPLIFASDDRRIVANGVIGCRKNDPGIELIVKRLLSLKIIPQWWDYGTMVFHNVYHESPNLFCIQDLKRVIPFTGKESALAVMKSKDEIEKARAAGAWAIHFEMAGTIDAGEICTINKKVV